MCFCFHGLVFRERSDLHAAASACLPDCGAVGAVLRTSAVLGTRHTAF